MMYEVNLSVCNAIVESLERVESHPHEDVPYNHAKKLMELGVAYISGSDTGMYWISLTPLGEAVVKRHTIKKKGAPIVLVGKGLKAANNEPITLGGIITSKLVKKTGKKGKKYTVKVETEKSVSAKKSAKKAKIMNKVLQL